jgi:hypothetical protein
MPPTQPSLNKACATHEVHASITENINLSALIVWGRVGVKASEVEVRSSGFQFDRSQ